MQLGDGVFGGVAEPTAGTREERDSGGLEEARGGKHGVQNRVKGIELANSIGMPWSDLMGWSNRSWRVRRPSSNPRGR